MTRWQIAVMLCLSGLVWGQPSQIFPEPKSPRIANYRIDAQLDPEHRLLAASQRILWYNTTDHPTSEIQMHLYLNAFRNDQSTFMKESGGRHRGNEIDKDKGWGFIDVTTVKGRALSEEEMGPFWNESQWPSLGDAVWSLEPEFIWPDDDNRDDKTVIRMALPEAIPPGGAVLLETTFDACLPTPSFARTGAKDEYFFVGQWFPKIGVFKPDGTWNCHQFHVNSEFFADFGTYDVYLTVPAENTVGATGLEVSVTDAGNQQNTHYYHAEDVHDFAWTTSSDFVEFKGQAQDVEIRVLMQSDHASQGQRHLKAAQLSVEYFQNWYGDYPFPNLTVVDPRRGAKGSGGMEYPTLITAGTAYALPEGVRAVELVIIHEFGHNFWYHLLASNEFEESWMDEGINTYTEIQIMADIYGPDSDAIDLPGLKIGDLAMQRSRYISGSDLDPMVRNAWEFYSNTSYGINSYSKPGVVLTTLQNYLGRETMAKVMKTYVERFSFKHPTSQDFVAVASEVAGEDLNWFFEQALYSNAEIDYSVSFIRAREVKDPKGFDFSMTREDLLSDSDVDTEDDDRDDKDKTWENEVRVRRLGDFVFPVELEVVFDDGEVVRETWDGQGLWTKYFYTRQSKIVSAQVDPDYKVVLDVDWVNNSKTLEPQRKPIVRMTTTWYDRFQLMLDLLAL